MKPSEALASNRAAIRQVVESHHARNARVFGSVLHGHDPACSDLDILIDPTPDTTLFDIGAIRHELAWRAGGRTHAQRAARQLPGKGSRQGPTDMSRDPQRLTDYLTHILEAIERIDNFEIIEEASNNIQKHYPEFTTDHPELPLSFAYQMRNALAQATSRWISNLSGGRSTAICRDCTGR